MERVQPRNKGFGKGKRQVNKSEGGRGDNEPLPTLPVCPRRLLLRNHTHRSSTLDVPSHDGRDGSDGTFGMLRRLGRVHLNRALPVGTDTPTSSRLSPSLTSVGDS